MVRVWSASEWPWSPAFAAFAFLRAHTCRRGRRGRRVCGLRGSAVRRGGALQQAAARVGPGAPCSRSGTTALAPCLLCPPPQLCTLPGPLPSHLTKLLHQRQLAVEGVDVGGPGLVIDALRQAGGEARNKGAGAAEHGMAPRLRLLQPAAWLHPQCVACSAPLRGAHSPCPGSGCGCSPRCCSRSPRRPPRLRSGQQTAG